LEKAHFSGFAPSDKGNGEIAIAFAPEFFIEYIRNMDSLHSFGECQAEFDVLTQIASNVELIVNEEILHVVNQKRQTTLLTINKKLRDANFRARVLTAYGFKCAFCDMQLKLIEAAHILPVSYEYSTDETKNGITLCALHHKAFDHALVTMNEQYRIIYNTHRMKTLKEMGHDGGMQKFITDLKPLIHVPPAIQDRPSTAYIKQANEIRGWNAYAI